MVHSITNECSVTNAVNVSLKAYQRAEMYVYKPGK